MSSGVRNSPAPFALWPVRLVVAMPFIQQGLAKLRDVQGAEGMFAAWGVPVPGLAAPLVGGVELLAGVGLVLGMFSRISAATLMVVSMAAIYFVKGALGFFTGWAFDLALAAGSLAVLLNGPGRPTLFSMLGKADLDPEDALWRRLRAKGKPIQEGRAATEPGSAS